MKRLIRSSTALDDRIDSANITNGFKKLAKSIDWQIDDDDVMRLIYSDIPFNSGIISVSYVDDPELIRRYGNHADVIFKITTSYGDEIYYLGVYSDGHFGPRFLTTRLNLKDAFVEDADEIHDMCINTFEEVVGAIWNDRVDESHSGSDIVSSAATYTKEEAVKKIAELERALKAKGLRKYVSRVESFGSDLFTARPLRIAMTLKRAISFARFHK